MQKQKQPTMLLSTARRLKLEAVALDNEREAAASTAERVGLTLRDAATWYLVANGHMVVKLHHEWIPEKVWGYLDPAVEDPHPLKSQSQYTRHDGIATRLSQLLPDWLTQLAPASGGLLSEVELVGLEVPWEGHKLRRAKETKTRMVAFSFQEDWCYADAAYTDLVRKFWPEAVACIAPTLTGRSLFGESVEYNCPLLFLASTADSGVEGECVGAVMPLRWGPLDDHGRRQ